MSDEEDLAGVGARGQVGGKLLALGFVVGEADFDQSMVGEGLVERGNHGIRDSVVSDMNDWLQFLGPGFEFAESWFVHVRKRKRE